jgi:hypothetical protein
MLRGLVVVTTLVTGAAAVARGARVTRATGVSSLLACLMGIDLAVGELWMVVSSVTG